MNALDRLPSDRPAIWAHRGASADAPENTLPAFLLAVEQGADGVELDAQLCRSGEVVVLHDSTLGRTAGHPGLVAETSWTQLRQLDAGHRLHARWAGTRIPLLAEVLEAVAPRLLVNVEIKSDLPDDRGLAAAVVRVIREAKARDSVLLSSFNPFCLSTARALDPDLPRAFLFEAGSPLPLPPDVTARLVGASAVHPEARLATPGAVARWHRKGWRVACWTVDDPERARRLASIGVSGLITNRPGLLRAALFGRRADGA
jgi:glycerophosphoryl diester phosphodiesterase